MSNSGSNNKKRQLDSTLDARENDARVDVILERWREKLRGEASDCKRREARYILRILPLKGAIMDPDFRGSLKRLESLQAVNWTLDSIRSNSFARCEPAVFFGKSIQDLVPEWDGAEEALLAESRIQFEIANYAHMDAHQLVENMTKMLQDVRNMILRRPDAHPSEEDIRRGRAHATGLYKQIEAQLHALAHEVGIAKEVLID
jgi:hypothetical protein